MKHIPVVLFCLPLVLSCKKFLSQQPSSTTYTPTSVSDFRGLMDYDALTVNATPALGILGADGFGITIAGWPLVEAVVEGASTWQSSIYQSQLINRSWTSPYIAINYCNQVLNGMDKMDSSDRQPIEEFNAVYGNALFDRAFHYYMLEETYGQLYDPSSPHSALGVPLRLTADVQSKQPRAGASDVYAQIIKDLTKALPLLPKGVQEYHNRPGQPAALALLTKVSMTMQWYTDALTYANDCINQYNALLDYDSLIAASASGSFSFADAQNPEILFQCSATDYASTYFMYMPVDSVLYASYAVGDERKVLYFKSLSRGGVYFNGNYTGNHFFFSGLAMDEVYLYRAECRARTGDVAGAMEDLNYLLSHRWDKTYQPYMALTKAEAMDIILREEKKELLFRETRWTDLRRFNFDTAHMDTLTRIANGQSYQLLPFSNGYTFLIPQSEIAADGGPQNPAN